MAKIIPISMFILCIFLSGLYKSMSAHGCENDPILILVDKYLLLDSQGARLSSDSYRKIAPLLKIKIINEEPAWDTVYVIEYYNIVDIIKKDEAKAIVDIGFKIVARISGEEIEPVETYKIDKIAVERIGGIWFISDYLSYPRLSVQTAIEHLTALCESADYKTTDNDRMEMLKKTAATGFLMGTPNIL